METHDLSKITSQDFKDLLGQALPVQFGPLDTISATVDKITDLETYSPLERGAFSVVFNIEGSRSYRPQGIYQLHHPSGGTLDLFLVPISGDQTGTKYEAVFS